MKKVLASTLALTMAASMTSMAFADVNATSIKVDDTSKVYTANKDGILTEVSGAGFTVKPGQTIYVEILPENPGEEIPNALPGKFKAVVEWNHGKELVDSASIETKKTSTTVYKFDGDTAPHGLANSYDSLDAARADIAGVKTHTDPVCQDDPCTNNSHFSALSQGDQDAIVAKYLSSTSTSYRSVAAIKLKASYSTKLEDLIGSLKVVKKTSSNSAAASSKKINATVGYAQTAASDTVEVDNDAPVIDFEDFDGDVEFVFGSFGSFVVSGKNQPNLFMGYSMKPVNGIIDQNPTANTDFLSFSAKPSFNRNGEFRIFGEEGKFLYEITNKGLKEIKAEFDEVDEAYVFQTRTLGSYVLSDKELKYTPSADDNDTETNPDGSNEGDKPHNPDTGAGMMLPIAMSMAAISLGVVGLTSKKSK